MMRVTIAMDLPQNTHMPIKKTKYPLAFSSKLATHNERTSAYLKMKN